VTGSRSIVLVGLMGSGKSTTGRALAGALRLPFVDNDELLQAREGRSAAALAAASGPEGVHRAEAAVARDALADPTPRVVALAASAVDDAGVRRALRDHDVVWLRATPATVGQRLAGHRGHRPSAADLGETLAAQAQRRAEAFADVASVVVDVDDRGVDDVVRRVLDGLRISSSPSDGPAG
jgi:shikimate kinase